MKKMEPRQMHLWKILKEKLKWKIDKAVVTDMLVVLMHYKSEIGTKIESNLP